MTEPALQGVEGDAAKLPDPEPGRLPQWHGFNLVEMMNAGSARPFVASDFEWISELGFDFVRLPMDYRCWTAPEDPYRVREDVLGRIDEAVERGGACGVHVCLNLHRAPGYCVSRENPEPLSLWADAEAQEQFDFQWSMFAGRYRGVPNARLSFNLVNEPARVEADAYVEVAKRAVAAVRREDPGRLVISDGLRWGNEPVFELAGLGVAQSTRGYQPGRVTHYKAQWIDSEGWPEPTWPLEADGTVWDREALRARQIEPWRALQSQGVGVHVGEFGCYRHTPHDVALALLGDYLSLWRQAGWGWAMWNFRGPFGILDSGRRDVRYESFRGHDLDRRLLELLKEHCR